MTVHLQRGTARTALIREAAEGLMVTLEELQRSTNEVESANVTTSNFGVYGRVTRREMKVSFKFVICQKRCRVESNYVEKRFWSEETTI